MKLTAILCFALCFNFTIAQNTDKDSPNNNSSWEFDTAPYFWLTGIKGNLGFLEQTVPVEVEFKDLFDHLRFGVMLHTEARKGKWSIMADLAYARLEEDGQINALDSSANLELKLLIAELGGAYQLLKFQEYMVLDGLAGVRLYSLNTELRINQSPVLDEALDFTDPYIGLRLRTFNDKWVNSLRFDVGGLGVGSETSWKLNAIVGYRLSELFTVFLGYQGYDVNYEGDNSLEYDIYTGGILTGLNLHF